MSCSYARLKSVAPSLGVALVATNVRNADEIDRVITTIANEPETGLIVLPHPITIAKRTAIHALTTRYRLPAIFPYRYFATDGGLMSYGPDQLDQWRGAATYIDRILRGEEKPADLPVQAPTKYELVINLKTAKALGLAVPPTLLIRADGVVEQLPLPLEGAPYCNCSGLEGALFHRSGRSPVRSAIGLDRPCREFTTY